MRFLTCVQVGPDAILSAHDTGTGDTNSSVSYNAVHAFQSRLLADLDVRCDIDARTRFGVAVPVLVVFSLGVPVVLGIMSCIRKGVSKGTQYQMSYLIANYAMHAQYWEAVAMIRKGLLAVLTAAVEPVGLAMQVGVTILVVVLNLFFVTLISPLRTRLENGLEQLSSVTLFLSFIPLLTFPDNFVASAAQEAALQHLGG